MQSHLKTILWIKIVNQFDAFDSWKMKVWPQQVIIIEDYLSQLF